MYSLRALRFDVEGDAWQCSKHSCVTAEGLESETPPPIPESFRAGATYSSIRSNAQPGGRSFQLVIAPLFNKIC